MTDVNCLFSFVSIVRYQVFLYIHDRISCFCLCLVHIIIVSSLFVVLANHCNNITSYRPLPYEPFKWMLHNSLKNYNVGLWGCFFYLMITCEFLIVRCWLKSVISFLTMNKRLNI